MPVDDRSDLDRLTRFQLYREAEAQGIQFPKDHPKYVWKNGQLAGGMVLLLQSHGVTKDTMKSVQWKTIYPSEQEIAAAGHQGTATSPQSYPIAEAHQSARTEVDHEAIREKRRLEDEAKNDEIAQLRAELARKDETLARVEEMLAQMENKKKNRPKREGNELKAYWALYRQAKSLGIPVERGTKADLIQEMIDGHIAERGQRSSEEDGAD